ncbi:MAG: AAA family ATPase [Clostridia bacterium]
MTKIIALTNQKGGVGKTTTAVNLSAALTGLGKKVLLCDFDPQGNATSGLGVDPATLKSSIYEVIISQINVKDAIVKTKWADIIGSNVNLAGAEIDLISMPDREFCLRNALRQLDGMYDYILIDCPPSLGILTINCLCAADTILVPLQCEYYALEGISQLIYTTKQIQKNFNPKIKLEGIALTMYDGRTNLSIQVVEEVKRHFADKVFASVIPRNVRLSEAPSHGQPICEYDQYSKGSKAYKELAIELLKRQG